MKWWVIALIILAGVLRLWRIDTDLLIHYDQGRDLLAARSIWLDHKMTLLGPSTDAEGVFFSPIYYYLISIPLVMSGGNPVTAIVFLISLELISLIFFYEGSKKLFGTRVAIMALALYATSYGLVSFSRWLSNAMPVIIVGNLMIYVLARTIEDKRWWVWYWFWLGVMFTFNPAAGIGLFVFGLIYGRTNLLKNLLVFLIPAIPQILFDLRHDFLISRGVMGILTNKFGGSASRFDAFWGTGKTMFNFINGVWGWGLVWLVAVGILLIIFGEWSKNKKMIFFWVFIQIGIMFLFNRAIYGHFFAGVAGGLVLLLALALKKYPEIVLGLVVFNIWLWWGGFRSPNLNLTPMGTANLVTLENRLKVVDFIGQSKEDYVFHSYDIPYFQDQVWRYLLWWKGVGDPGQKSKILYAVSERDWDRPDRLTDWKENLGKISRLEKNLVVGDFVVEKRIFK
jgi:hypothetical protein